MSFSLHQQVMLNFAHLTDGSVHWTCQSIGVLGHRACARGKAARKKVIEAEIVV